MEELGFFSLDCSCWERGSQPKLVTTLKTIGRQYGGLFAISAVEALIFAPFLYYVFNVRQAAGDVWVAAIITAMGFAGLSLVGWVTRTDLSFLRPILIWGGVAAMVLIVSALLFGMNIGTWFSVAMVALMGVSILYNTQNSSLLPSTSICRSSSNSIWFTYDNVLVHSPNRYGQVNDLNRKNYDWSLHPLAICSNHHAGACCKRFPKWE